MRCLVTGAAGFIGSTLSEHLVSLGHEVTGVDCFTPYYDTAIKQSNADRLSANGIEVLHQDLVSCDLGALLEGTDVVFHLAGQPGVRSSWSSGFDDHVRLNLVATQRLLEAAKGFPLSRFVFASSSSVYGEAPQYPTGEDSPTKPHSPYGVTKLAAEHLCGVYAQNWNVPAVSLRFFTVYGPRQRPDMAMNRFLSAVLHDRPVTVFGSGEQIRDFTYVSDVAAAAVAAATADLAPGTVLNVAGGSSVTVNSLLKLMAEVTGRKVAVQRIEQQAGDVSATGGSIELAQRLLGWRPETSLETGLAAEWAWISGRA